MSDPCIHVALLPSAGIGHLTPFLRVGAFLVRQNCRVTLITPQPTVSLAESQLISRFITAFPQVTQIHLHLLPFDASTANSTDPFWLQFESVRRSAAQLLHPLLATVSPPLTAFIYDMIMISSVVPVSESLCLPSYGLYTSSARMFSLYSYFPYFSAASFKSDVLEVPGIPIIPRSSGPTQLLAPNSLFNSICLADSVKLGKLNGVIINTFQDFEEQTLEAVNEGKVREGLPPLFPLGPLMPCEFEKVNNPAGSSSPLKWLDDQPEGSVVYVCFGSRTATKKEQVREIADGLARSGCRFLWVVKDKKVDREEEHGLEELLGPELKRLKEKGLVVKTWVDQWEILGHKAIGGFLSHCGWNSVMEAVWHGVRILAWPHHGDQKINAEVVEMNGMGTWHRKWGWGEELVVEGQEIGNAIMEMMSDDSLKINATKLKVAARNAQAVGGSCQVTFHKLVQEWQNKVKS